MEKDPRSKTFKLIKKKIRGKMEYSYIQKFNTGKELTFQHLMNPRKQQH
jgi:hypothetical protein